MAIAYHTDPGSKRRDNEDYVGAFTNQAGRTMVIVADGVTSNEGGEVASAMTVEHFGHAWQNSSMETIVPTITWIKEQAKIENKAIIDAGQRFQELSQMATTVVLAILFDEKIVVANLGDSKAFLLHRDQLIQLSNDHVLKNEMVRRGVMATDDAKKIAHANSVTRFLGVDKYADIEISQHKFVDDDILFLTSDGITKVLSDDTIKRIMRYEETLEIRVFDMIQQANIKGAPDNVTAVLVTHEKD
ncbi:protein phosphatase [Leuconostoc litchii]|uniref:Serine/threonine-protein phosphatase n=1 Tax=Leuconostoc litchii TaxID=1981069 RepID=A0A6P2CKK4_9LACO|nr:protein phosphatase 2C domain-containing protein [Leuconostoc litchii]TYC46578.1 serine/threonine-protein phosphatase [Leuconostoc litchii]GMA70431.1 protein phosphatase [Leuconostoc litchii]